MTGDAPKPTFFDRAWWQQFTSNALGSAVGTGITALVGLFAAVAAGIVQLPDGPSRLVSIVVALLFGGMFVFVGVASLYAARTRPKRKRFNLIAGILLLVLGAANVTTLIVGALTKFPYR